MNETDNCGATLDASALIGLKKVARMLDTSVRTVQRLIARGDLPQVIRIGKLAKLQVRDVLNYIETLKQVRQEKE